MSTARAIRGRAAALPWTAVVGLALSLMTVWAAGCGPAAAPAASPGGDVAVAAARSGVAFGTHALLEEHYRKHCREFGTVSLDQYLHIAQQLRDRPVSGDVLEITRADGVVSRFDRGTGTFVAFDPSGVIRTCFRPRDGERYFRRQAARGGRGR